MRKIVIAAACIAAPVVLAAPLVPVQAQVERSRTVHHADLDLGKEGDVRTLDRRIERAAREVCGIASDADLEGQNAVRRCRADTIARAAAQRERALAASAEQGGIVLSSR